MYIVLITKERSTKNINFMSPGAGVLVLGCGHLSHIVKMHYFFKNLLLYSQAYIYSIDKQGSVYQNCNFHDPRGRGSCARVWPYKSYSENALLL